MVSLILFFIILSSGSAFACARHGREYSEILPLTCMGAVFILYGAGLAGNLYAGVVIISVIAAVLYGITAVFLVRTKSAPAFAGRFFSWTFWVYAGITVLLYFCLCGIRFSSYDEFTHWGECVKLMFETGRFALWSPRSLFPSYPPGMALFQYLFLKLPVVSNSAVFEEWKAVLAYRLFCSAFLVRILGQIPARSRGEKALCAGVLFAAPLAYFTYYYQLILIDSFLATVTGAGFACILCADRDDSVLCATISGICGLLPLSKDSGLFFAVFIAAAYLLMHLLDAYVETGHFPRKKKLLYAVLPIVLILGAELSWTGVIRWSGREEQFSNKINIPEYLRAFWANDSTVPRYEVLQAYKEKLFTPSFGIGNTDASVSYALLVVMGIFGFYFVFRLLLNGEKRRRKMLPACILLAMELLYLIFIGAIYMYNDFTDAEAARLASVERYVSTVLLAVWIALLGLFLAELFRSGKRNTGLLAVIVLAVVLATTPLLSIKRLLNQDYIRTSLEKRADYESFAGTIEEVCEENARVYLILQEGNGEEYYMLRYLADSVNTEMPFGSFNIGTKGSQEDSSAWRCTAPEWQTLLGDYDYAALFRINKSFVRDYGSLFADPAQIEEGCVYRINHVTGLLERCR